MSMDLLSSRKDYALSLVPIPGITPKDIPDDDYLYSGFNFSGGLPGTSQSTSPSFGGENDTLDLPSIDDYESYISLIWVTDPNIYPQHNDIISALQSARFDLKLLDTTRLYRNTFEIKAVIRSLPDVLDELTFGDIKLSKDSPINDLIEFIGKIKFTPLVFSLESGYEDNPDYIGGMINIIEEYTSSETNIRITNIKTYKLEGDLIFIPYSNGYPLYLYNPEDIRIRSELNPDNFYGYDVLSSDPLIIHTLNKYQKKNSDKLDPEYFIVKNGLVLIKIDMEPLNFHVIKNELLGMMDRCRRNGVFVIPSDPRIAFGSEYSIDRTKLDLYRELAKKWKGDIKSNKYPVIVKSNIDFSIPVNAWYEQSVDRILSGTLPLYRTNKPSTWRDESVSNQNRETLRVKFMYSAVKSYATLTEKYPHLKPYFSSPQVHYDLSVEAAFSDYQEFEDYMDILKSELIPDRNSTVHYSVLAVDNLTDAIATRSYYNVNKTNNSTLIVEPLSGQNVKYMIVVESHDGFFTGDVSKDQLKQYRTELNDMLRKYYNLCNYPGQDISFDRMSLDDMLKLVPIYDPDNDKTACLPSDLLDERSILFNPTTKQPYNEETISTYKNLHWALLGYFTVGRLSGIMDKPPIRPKVWIELGYPIIETLNATLPGKDYFVDEVTADISFYNEDMLVDTNNVNTFWDSIKNQYLSINNVLITDGINTIRPKIGLLINLLDMRLLPMSSEQYDEMISSRSEIKTILDFEPQALLSPISSPISSPIASPIASPIYSPISSPVPIISPIMSPISSPVFSPTNTNKGMVERLIENLWRCGYFMDDWSLSVYQSNHKISKSPFKLDSIVRAGGNSIFDGYNTLIHLKINEAVLC